MRYSAHLLSSLAVSTIILYTPVYAEDSATLLQLQSNPPVSQQNMAREQYLENRYAELKTALSQKNLSKEQKSTLKTEYKSIKKELKAVQRANKKARRNYDKQIAELKRNLEKQYGLGPYPAEIASFVAMRPEALRPFYKSLFIEGERNAVLNFNRLGLAAMEMGYISHAEWAFDRSIDKIEAIYANNPQAKAAKSKFKAESVKDYKGEPYERAMAYYYRGLLYLKEGDFENARAVFRAGEYQDTVSESEDFQADFAVLNYLNGWSLHCQGREAGEAFARAQEFRPGIVPPLPEHNMLFIAEIGSGPIKYGAGEYKEILKFKPDTRYGETSAFYGIRDAEDNDKQLPTYLASSTYWQATTRGGRPVDGILEGKAEFKKTTQTVGNVAMEAGKITALAGLASGDSDAALVGAGLAVVGGLFKAVSKSSKPEADTRRWENLPDGILVSTDSITFGQPYKFGAFYSGADGAQNVAEPTQAYLTGSNGTCGIVWSRSRSALNVGESSPGARQSWKEMRKRKAPVQKRDVMFRNWLITEAPTSEEGPNI